METAGRTMKTIPFSGISGGKKEIKNDRLEEIDSMLNEAQAIFAFLDEATDGLLNASSRYCDDIHKESSYGLHLCFELALERMAKARNMLVIEINPGLERERKETT